MSNKAIHMKKSEREQKTKRREQNLLICKKRMLKKQPKSYAYSRAMTDGLKKGRKVEKKIAFTEESS